MLLAIHRGETVGIDRIVEALWDVDLPLRPDRNVAAMVSRPEAGSSSDLVTGSVQQAAAAGMGIRPQCSWRTFSGQDHERWTWVVRCCSGSRD
jgi:hypothetical protein